MMNGPEHYKEAERLIDLAHDMMDQGAADQEFRERAQFVLDRAQVHATLAQVQATIDAAPSAHSLTEWGKRNADSKPSVIEEAEPEPPVIEHAARMEKRTVPVPGTVSTREVYEVWCVCGYVVPGTFADKQVALDTLRGQHPEAAQK